MYRKFCLFLTILLLPLFLLFSVESVNALDYRISTLISGEEFNELVQSAESIIFSNEPVPSEFILSAIDVSTSDSFYKTYLYVDNGVYVIAPQFEGVSIYSNPNSSFMFSGCAALKSISFDNFNTSSVYDMRDMFELCQSLEILDLSNFDTSNVKYMQYMFNACSNLYSLNIDSFDLSSLEDNTHMFKECPYLFMYNQEVSLLLNEDLPLLTSSYQLLGSATLGKTDYGTVYLRLYAKLDSQDSVARTSTVSYQSRIYYNKGSGYTFYSNSGTYKYLSGSGATSVNKVSCNGTYKGGETILSTITGIVNHDDNGEATVSASCRWSSSPWAWDKTVTASASVPDLSSITKYSITINSSPDVGGSVSGGGLYLEGDIATLTATPEFEYLFECWSDGVTDNPREITVNSDMSLTAIFTSMVSSPNIPTPPNNPPKTTYNEAYDSIISSSSSSIISGGSLSMIQVDHYNTYTVLRTAESDEFFDNRNDNFYTYVVSDDGVGHYIFLVYDYSEIFVHAPNMIVSQSGLQPLEYSYTNDKGQLVSIVYPSGDGIIQSDISEFYIKFSESYLYNNYSYTNLPFSNSLDNQNHLEWVGTKTIVYKSNLGKQFANISVDDSNSPYTLNFMICDKSDSLDSAKLQEQTQKGNNILSGISGFFNELINGNEKSNSIVSSQSTFNDKVQNRFDEFNSIESDYLDNFNESLNNIDTSKFDISSFGLDFAPTANFVSSTFEELTDNYFGLALGFSLIVGFALLLFGRRL